MEPAADCVCAKTCAAPRCVPASRRRGASVGGGACVFVPFLGDGGSGIENGPGRCRVGATRRGNGFWFDKRPTSGGGRPMCTCENANCTRILFSSSANFFFFHSTPGHFFLFPPPPPLQLPLSAKSISPGAA